MINFKSKNRSDCSCFFVVHIKRTANGFLQSWGKAMRFYIATGLVNAEHARKAADVFAPQRAWTDVRLTTHGDIRHEGAERMSRSCFQRTARRPRRRACRCPSSRRARHTYRTWRCSRNTQQQAHNTLERNRWWIRIRQPHMHVLFSPCGGTRCLPLWGTSWNSEHRPHWLRFKLCGLILRFYPTNRDWPGCCKRLFACGSPFSKIPLRIKVPNKFLQQHRKRSPISAKKDYSEHPFVNSTAVFLLIRTFDDWN